MKLKSWLWILKWIISSLADIYPPIFLCECLQLHFGKHQSEQACSLFCISANAWTCVFPTIQPDRSAADLNLMEIRECASLQELMRVSSGILELENISAFTLDYLEQYVQQTKHPLGRGQKSLKRSQWTAREKTETFTSDIRNHLWTETDVPIHWMKIVR